MEDFGNVIKGYIVVMIILSLIGIWSIVDGKNEWNEAIPLEENYAIYYEGYRVDKNTFSIESINTSNYKVRINHEKEEIYINKK